MFLLQYILIIHKYFKHYNATVIMIMRKLSSPVFHSVHQIWCVSRALARFTNEYELVELNIVKTSFDLTVDYDYAVK